MKPGPKPPEKRQTWQCLICNRRFEVPSGRTEPLDFWQAAHLHSRHPDEVTEVVPGARKGERGTTS